MPPQKKRKNEVEEEEEESEETESEEEEEVDSDGRGASSTSEVAVAKVGTKVDAKSRLKQGNAESGNLEREQAVLQVRIEATR